MGEGASIGDKTAMSSSNTVFVETNLGSHLALIVSQSNTISALKKKIAVEFPLCFPNIGEVEIEALKVKRRGKFYRLSESMLVKNAFCRVKGSWFVSVDARPLKERADDWQLLGPSDSGDSGRVKLIDYCAERNVNECDQHVEEMAVAVPGVRGCDPSFVEMICGNEVGKKGEEISWTTGVRDDVRDGGENKEASKTGSHEKSKHENEELSKRAEENDTTTLDYGKTNDVATLPENQLNEHVNENGAKDNTRDGAANKEESVSLAEALETGSHENSKCRRKKRKRAEENDASLLDPGKTTSQSDPIVSESWVANVVEGVLCDLKRGMTSVADGPSVSASSNFSMRSRHKVHPTHVLPAGVDTPGEVFKSEGPEGAHTQSGFSHHNKKKSRKRTKDAKENDLIKGPAAPVSEDIVSEPSILSGKDHNFVLERSDHACNPFPDVTTACDDGHTDNVGENHYLTNKEFGEGKFDQQSKGGGVQSLQGSRVKEDLRYGVEHKEDIPMRERALETGSEKKTKRTVKKGLKRTKESDASLDETDKNGPKKDAVIPMSSFENAAVDVGDSHYPKNEESINGEKVYLGSKEDGVRSLQTRRIEDGLRHEELQCEQDTGIREGEVETVSYKNGKRKVKKGHNKAIEVNESLLDTDKKQSNAYNVGPMSLVGNAAAEVLQDIQAGKAHEYDLSVNKFTGVVSGQDLDASKSNAATKKKRKREKENKDSVINYGNDDDAARPHITVQSKADDLSSRHVISRPSSDDVSDSLHLQSTVPVKDKKKSKKKMSNQLPSFATDSMHENIMDTLANGSNKEPAVPALRYNDSEPPTVSGTSDHNLVLAGAGCLRNENKVLSDNQHRGADRETIEDVVQPQQNEAVDATSKLVKAPVTVDSGKSSKKPKKSKDKKDVNGALASRAEHTKGPGDNITPSHPPKVVNDKEEDNWPHKDGKDVSENVAVIPHFMLSDRGIVQKTLDFASEMTSSQVNIEEKDRKSNKKYKKKKSLDAKHVAEVLVEKGKDNQQAQDLSPSNDKDMGLLSEKIKQTDEDNASAVSGLNRSKLGCQEVEGKMPKACDRDQANNEMEASGRSNGINFQEYFGCSRLENVVSDGVTGESTGEAREIDGKTKADKVDKNPPNKRPNRQQPTEEEGVVGGVRKFSAINAEEVVDSSDPEKRVNKKSGALSKDNRVASDANEDLPTFSDASTKTPSDYSWSSDYSDGESNTVNSLKRGSTKGGGKKSKKAMMSGMSLNEILRSSSSYKKAKINASHSEMEDTESQPVDFVPDSCPNV